MIRIKRRTIAAAALIIVFAAGELQSAFEYSGRAAREEGMAGAFVSLSDDSSSVFHNPAGLSRLQVPQMMTGYGGLFLGMDDGELTNSVITAAYPFDGPVGFLKDESIGVGWSRLDAGGLYREDSFVVGFGAGLGGGLRAGFGINFLSVGYGEDDYTRINPVFDSGYSSSAISGDIGLMLDYGRYTFGLGAFNINSPDVGLKYSNEIPLSLKGGVTVNYFSGSLSLQGDYNEDDFSFKAGGEKHFLNRKIFARGGLKLGTRKERKAALGISYDDAWYRVDYSLVYPLSGVTNTLGTHKLNVSFYFGEREFPEKPEVVREIPEEVEDEAPEEPEDPEEPESTAEDIERSIENTNEAEELMNDGNYKRAYRLLEEAADLWDGNTAAEKLKEQLRPVAEVYEEVEDEDSLKARSVSAYFEGDGDKAVNRIRYASQLNPEDDSLKELRRIIEREFSSVASQQRLIPGLTVVEQKLQEVLESIYDKRWTRAISLCEEVLDLEPDNVLALKRMGSAYYGMGSRARAEEIWRRALELDPEDRELQHYLGMRDEVPDTDNALLREFENALNYYNKLVEAGAGADTRIQVLERIIATYENRDVDLDSLRRELNRLR